MTSVVQPLPASDATLFAVTGSPVRGLASLPGTLVHEGV